MHAFASVIALVARVKSAAGVQPDANREQFVIQRTLDRNSGLHRRARGRKGREETVTRLLDHLAAARRDAFAKQAIMLCERLLPLLRSEGLHELG